MTGRIDLTPPGRWTGRGLPNRRDAIRLAVECLNESVQSFSADVLGWVGSARGWIELAKVADLPAPENVDVSGVYGFEGGTRLAMCMHGIVVLHTGHQWVHPIGMGACDRPPTD